MNFLEKITYIYEQKKQKEVTRLQTGLTPCNQKTNGVTSRGYDQVTPVTLEGKTDQGNTPPAVGQGQKDLGKCYTCGSSKWWRHTTYRKWICGICHPPANQDHIEWHSL